MQRYKIQIILLVLVFVVTSLCSCTKSTEDDNPIKIRPVKEGSQAFLLDSSKASDVKQYIANFQKALNNVTVKDIQDFISPSKQTTEYLKYLQNKDLRPLFLFYMKNVKLEYKEVVSVGERKFMAVDVSFYDNRYNDFNKPQIMDKQNPRQDFYDRVQLSIDERLSEAEAMGSLLGIDELTGLPEQPEEGATEAIGVPKSELIVSNEINEKTGLPIIVIKGESNIEKSTSHRGWDYTTGAEIDEWITKLEEIQPNLEVFHRVMFFEILPGTEYTTIAVELDDLVTLFGNLPVFHGLDSVYAIQDYDMYYNWVQFQDELSNMEEMVYAAWDKIRSMSDAEVQTLSLDHLAENNKVFGRYDINNDLDKIRQNTLPAELGVMLDMYYTEQSRAYYTFLYENPHYRKFLLTLQKHMDIELLKQSGKDFHVMITMPDLDNIWLQHRTENTTPEQVIELMTSQLEAGAYNTIRVYSRVTLQKSSGTKWGFQMTNLPWENFLASATTPSLREALGLDQLLNAKLDNDGFLVAGLKK